MKKTVLSALAFATALGACASPEQASNNRATHMANLLPNPADREGIFLIFPISSSLLVEYFPNQVTEAQILGRVTGFCTNPTRGEEPTTADTATMADGTVLASQSFVIDCNNSFS